MRRRERNEKNGRREERKENSRFIEEKKPSYPNRYKGELSSEKDIVEDYYNPTYPSRYR
jgi:hypothetical protein